MSAALILCERSGRWAASLRRHGLVERLRLVETRSLAELGERLCESPHALIGLELSGATVDSVIDWLSGRRVHPSANAAIVFAERGLRAYELLCREAGAVHFVASELELFSLGAVVDRYLLDPAFAKMDEAEPTLAAWIRRHSERSEEPRSPDSSLRSE